jgi:hypothetical protein
MDLMRHKYPKPWRDLANNMKLIERNKLGNPHLHFVAVHLLPIPIFTKNIPPSK